MPTTNAFFKQDDPTASRIAGYNLPSSWWSRTREYPWALSYASSGQIVADMGAGWMGRPFKDALAETCNAVYAVDVDNRLLTQAKPDNVAFVVADFTKPIEVIPSASLDRIFCISVLEDLADGLQNALGTFVSLLKPDGLIVITFDVQYDSQKPLGAYPAVDFADLEDSMACVGLEHAYDVDLSKEGAVYHEGFNLCCFHAVMRKHENN